MENLVPLGTGNSRFMKSNIPSSTTLAQLIQMLNNGTFPYDIGTINPAGISQQGTPLNKDTLLKDATAALYGLTPTAVPNDVFSFLGKYNLYWWKRRTYQSQWVSESQDITVTNSNCTSWFVMLNFDSDGSYDVRYADSIQVNDDGEISLVNPQTVSVDDRDSASVINVIAGKYCAQMTYNNGETGKILFIPSGQSAKKETKGNTMYWYFTNTKNITSKFVEEIGEWEYIQSSNKETYPDSGISGGYEYQFLGVPFDNAVTSVKIETGSYVGTGTYGSSHRNTLTFNGKPMLVYIGCDDSGPYMVTPFINPSGIGIAASGTQTDSLNATWGENSVSWYGTRSSSYQFNYTQTYNYIALTIPGGDT